MVQALFFLSEFPIFFLLLPSFAYTMFAPIVLKESIANQVSASSRYKVVENLLRARGLNINETDAQGRTVSSIVDDYGSRGGALAHYMGSIKNLLEKRPLLRGSSV
jgi:hypothetical protein